VSFLKTWHSLIELENLSISVRRLIVREKALVKTKTAKLD